MGKEINEEINEYIFIVKGCGVRGGSMKRFLEEMYYIHYKHTIEYPDKSKNTSVDIYSYKIAHRTNIYAIVIKNPYKEIINDIRSELTRETIFSRTPFTIIIAEGYMTLNKSLWKPLE